MEGLDSLYAQDIYGMDRENIIMDHQGSDFIWGLNDQTLDSCFLSDFGVISEIQHQQQNVGDKDSTFIDSSSLDCLISATANIDNLWSFGGFSSGESQNIEATTSTTRKVKSLNRNRGSHISLDKEDFKLANQSKSKKPRTDKEKGGSWNTSNQHSTSLSEDTEPDEEEIKKMKEMIYRTAMFRPMNLALETMEKPKRKNVRVSKDPQTVAARERRERISEKIRVLQTLVPGGKKMDTASMLEEAANYLKFLRAQVRALDNLRPKLDPTCVSFSSVSSLNYSSFFPLLHTNHIHHP
ncbi:unnamed protein product [Cochlearia groenlandica]